MKRIIILYTCIIIGMINNVASASKYFDSDSDNKDIGNVINVVKETQKKNNNINNKFEQKVEERALVQEYGTNRIANGFSIFTRAIEPYIQWVLYFGMSASVILIIYNGFIIVVNAGEDKVKSAKENIKHIAIGLIILLGFAVIIKIMSGLLLKLLGG